VHIKAPTTGVRRVASLDVGVAGPFDDPFAGACPVDDASWCELRRRFGPVVGLDGGPKRPHELPRSATASRVPTEHVAQSPERPRPGRFRSLASRDREQKSDLVLGLRFRDRIWPALTARPPDCRISPARQFHASSLQKTCEVQTRLLLLVAHGGPTAPLLIREFVRRFKSRWRDQIGLETVRARAHGWRCGLTE
jgi:hypothetical protein